MNEYSYGDTDDLWIDLSMLIDSFDEDPDSSQNPDDRYFEHGSVHTSSLDTHKQESFPTSIGAMSNQMAGANIESYSRGLPEVPFLSRNVVGSDPSNGCQSYDGLCGYERQYTYSQSSLSSNNVVDASNCSMITNNRSEFIHPNDNDIFHIDEDGNFSSINSFTPKSSTGMDEETQDGPVTSNTIESFEKECYSVSQGAQYPMSTNASIDLKDINDGESFVASLECHPSQAKVHDASILDYVNENFDACGTFHDKNVSKKPSMIMQLVDMNDEMLRKELLDPNTGSHVLDANSGLSTETSNHGSPAFDESHDLCIVNDSDVCVVEDISGPARISPCREMVAQSTSFSAVGSARLKTIDERLILRVAMQDLSQPKSEASPPDGFLAVPLLRHQRIALSWMVQKETSGWYCSGGILADDQGLGKTVSTIALILKERRPETVRGKEMRPGESKTFNLEEDEDAVTKHVGLCDPKVLSKGRPSAGTLIVCPTCVLRQWDEELRKKVTDKANLSVLIYHGGNRTKDPHELAKYDVVLTTYSIVSMEVPKKQSVDDDEADREKLEASLTSDFYPSQKRKHSYNNTKRCFKGQKRLDGSFVELDTRPLAKVGWFRVVLDEAQSIKNHRTQVARACWGLRAKRRWCLSGTPIQNAIDDLYSYFRFLRYDPFVTYKAFYSAIKVPISRSPVNGYKKLQAVLKTIMLRRTKGTLLDGKPIIALPPKSIELKKVDFSKEERDFYTRLEADSRAQFEVYAAQGTVKQNYVNILLMLLRLRQACDHPLLVRKSSCNSVWKSSLEAARNLPVERQASLLSCLEASLAICSICNDAPEDAVVAVCGHVFCNQCISEHLTGNNIPCPSWNCKFRLNTSSMFSRDTLNTSLLGGASSQLSEITESGSSDPFMSSKIKAAIQALESVSNLRRGEMNRAPESSYDTVCSEGSPLAGKAIVFSQWTRMLDLLEECLKKSSLEYRRLDGTMSVAARDKAVKDFNSLPQVSVMIMSLKAASLGLNMVAACHVLMLDLWWNPTTEDQAIDRAHRIGQTRPVKVLRLTVKDTVEDRILALQQKKREMVASAFGEDETGTRQACLTVDDLKFLFTA